MPGCLLVTRSLNSLAQFVFFTGVFVIWVTHWSQQSDNSKSEDLSHHSHRLASSVDKLLVHLKITLYHELAHLRTLVRLYISYSQPTLTYCNTFRFTVPSSMRLWKNVLIIPPRYKSYNDRVLAKQLVKQEGRQRLWLLVKS